MMPEFIDCNSHFGKSIAMKNAFLALLAGSVLLGGCATNPVTGQQNLVLMSEQEEIAIGRQVNEQVLQQYSVYQDAALQDYVQQVGTRVAASSHRPGLEYRFTVLNSPEVNAFALPGGFVYITRGLMAYLNSEAELAAVLGHEVGHVTARHAVRRHSATQLTSIGAAIGAAFIPGLGGQAGQQLTGLLGNALLRGYGREHELEADELGAEYLARADYTSDAMFQVIRVLKNQELFESKMAQAEGRQPRVYHGLFATHPDNDTRLKEVIAAAEKIEPSNDPFVGRARYLRRTEGLVFGEGAAHGVVRGRDFHHAGLGFGIRFPGEWQINSLPDGRVFAAAPENAALLQLTVRPREPGMSPRAYMSQRLGITQLDDDQPLTINGLTAHTGNAVVNTGDGRRIARLTVIYHGDRALVIAGLPRDPREAARYDGVFLEATRSFRPLTAQEREAAAAVQRLHSIEADAQTTFATLTRASPLKVFAEEQLRLINGRYPDGGIRAGELIKTVR